MPNHMIASLREGVNRSNMSKYGKSKALKIVNDIEGKSNITFEDAFIHGGIDKALYHEFSKRVVDELTDNDYQILCEELLVNLLYMN